MGQHKTNPVAIAAKEGKLPPKQPKPSKREREAELNAMVNEAMRKVVGVAPSDLLVMNKIREFYR